MDTTLSNRIVSLITTPISRWLQTPHWSDIAIPLGVTGILAGLTFTPTAAAQVGLGEASDVLCNVQGFNVGQAVTILIGLFTLIFLGKAMFRFMRGMDQTGSQREQTVRKGNEQIKGSGRSIVAAFAPLLFVGFIEAIGVSVASCVFPFA